ncbi:leucine-rich repeat domain-containing protein [Achromobacter marplatensis]|uniref:hypothetical protein n=1 Tax=Achromobacter marplatensis TaxID=470868 RepID=UPI0039F665AD
MNISGSNFNSTIFPNYSSSDSDFTSPDSSPLRCDPRHICYIRDNILDFLAEDIPGFKVVRQLNNRNRALAPRAIKNLAITQPEGFSRFFDPEKKLTEQPARPTHLTLRFPVSTEQLRFLPDSITHIDFACRGFFPRTFRVEFLDVLAQRCPNIQSMSLRRNQLTADAVAVLQKFEKLTALDLTGCYIGNEGMKAVAKLPNLTSLNVGRCDIGVEGVKELSKLLNLSTLDVSDNLIGSAGAAEVAKLLGLTVLNMSGTVIGADGVMALAALPVLRTLDLSNNILFGVNATALEKFDKLSCLKLARCDIKGQIPMNIAKLENLSELNLANNEIGPEGLKELVKLPKLSNLNLSANKLGHAATQEVAKILTLTALDLSNDMYRRDSPRSSDNKLDYEALAELAKLPQLSVLDLSRNAIDHSLAAALTRFAHLSTLKLVKCSIRDQEVAELVKFNIGDQERTERGQFPSFSTLDLSNNLIGDEGVTLLVKRGNVATLILHENSDITAAHIEEVRAVWNTPQIDI